MSSSRRKWIRRAVILATLLICAFFVAQGLTHWIAAKLPAGKSIPVATMGRIGANAGARKKTRDALPILKRNIFDSELGRLDIETSVSEEGEAEVEVVTAKPSVNAPACDGNIKLVAAVHNPRDPDWSHAAMATGSEKAKLYRKGNQVDGKQVVEIWSQRVFLAQGSGVCQLRMFAPVGEKSSTKPSPVGSPLKSSLSLASVAKKKKEGAITSELMEQNISKISDTKYNVQRTLMDTVLQNQGELMKQARLIPHEEGGRVTGVKMYGIRRNSLLGRLGMKNGDLLKTINGYDMSSPNAALEAYTKLMSANQLTVSVTRRGKPISLEYSIQ